MTLVDTSVWVDHFRDGNRRLTELLNNQEVLIHPFVVGELSLGLLKNRVQILDLLEATPGAYRRTRRGDGSGHQEQAVRSWDWLG